MPTSFPGALDSLTNPTSANNLPSPAHSTQHATINDAMEAVQAKLGIGASTATSGQLLIGDGTGSTAFGNTLTAADASSTPLTLKGFASQTADLLKVLRNDGAVRLQVKAAGVEGGLFHVTDVSLNKPTSDHRAIIRGQGTAMGISSDASQLRLIGGYFNVSDNASVVNKTITNAANNGSGLIRITTSTAHGFSTGDSIGITNGILGTTEARGQWLITVISSTTFDLVGSTFTNAYTSGGVATNRPMMNGLAVTVGVSVARNAADFTGTTAINGEDVGGVTIQNAGTAKATGAVYVASSPTVTGEAWEVGFQVDADVGYGLIISGDATNDAMRVSGACTYGLNLSPATISGSAILLANNSPFSAKTAAGVVTELFRMNADNRFQINTAMRIPNATSFFGRNAAGSADVALFQIDSTNRLAIKATTIIDDGLNVQLGTTTGTKFGSTTSQKLGFWNATPIVQPTTSVSAATFVENSGTAVNDASTFDGYTLGKVVKALRNAGLLA